jgi:hypothetical protein
MCGRLAADPQPGSNPGKWSAVFFGAVLTFSHLWRLDLDFISS